MRQILKYSPILLAWLLGACAVGPIYQPPAPAMTPAALITAKPCTQLLPDANLSVNVRTGWSKVAPASMEALSCGGRMQPYYCQPSGCADMDIKALPAESQRGQTWHGVVDVLVGEVAICVQPALYFGFGPVPCEARTCAVGADRKPVRCVAEYKVTTDKANGTALNLHIVAKPGGAILGQVGFAEIPPWGG